MRLFLLLVVIFIACNNAKINDEKIKVENKENVIDTSIHEKAIQQRQAFDTVSYFKNEFNIKLNLAKLKYISDTIERKQIKLLVYGGFYNIDIKYSNYYTYIDSIQVIENPRSTLKNEGIGGYLLGKEKKPFERIIRVNDVNNDGELDIQVFNSLASGNSNSTYDVFISKNSKYSLNPIFSLPHLKYDSLTNVYTSKGHSGAAGKIYKMTTYKYIQDELIPIVIESQVIDNEKNVYLRTTENLETNSVKTEEIKYKE